MILYPEKKSLSSHKSIFTLFFILLSLTASTTKTFWFEHLCGEKVAPSVKKNLEKLLISHGCENFIAPMNVYYSDGNMPLSITGLLANDLYISKYFFSPITYNNDNERVMMLLHERGHQYYHHTLLKSTLLPLLLMITSCLPDNLASLIMPICVLLMAQQNLALSPLSRICEKQADLFALTNAPNDAHRKAFINYFEKVSWQQEPTENFNFKEWLKDPDHPKHIVRKKYLINHSTALVPSKKEYFNKPVPQNDFSRSQFKDDPSAQKQTPFLSFSAQSAINAYATFFILIATYVLLKKSAGYLFQNAP